MTTLRLLELAVALLLLGVSLWLYRRPSTDGYGSQGAVLLLVAGALVLAHSLGAFEYRPTQSELEARQG
ncbi:MAG: hypothetical protein V4513_03225 [Pseudomonadota bacterium]